MEINDIITFEDNKEYLILDITDYNNAKYIYTVRIDEEEIPTNEYKYFKVFVENNDYRVEEVGEENLIKLLTSLFTTNYLNTSINNGEQAA